MNGRIIGLFTLVFVLYACEKQPDDVDPIADHPEFIGEWKNMNPEIRENEKCLASSLSIQEDGSCSFEGGLQNTFGSFGYKNGDSGC